MINVAGHRIGITEVESALASHPKVAEAAVVSKPHAIKGQSLVAHVVLKTSQHRSDSLKVELRQYVRKGSARSRRSTISSSRTSSRRPGPGRFMRRVIRFLVSGQETGDTTALEDPGAVEEVRKWLEAIEGESS